MGPTPTPACAPRQSPGQRPGRRPGSRIKNSSKVARVPQATGGRAAHPEGRKGPRQGDQPKEKQKSSGPQSQPALPDLVRERGHLFEGDLPLVLEDRFEEITRTGDVIAALALGVYADVERAKASRKVRAGRGTMRGRRYKQRKSVLIVTGTNRSGRPEPAGVDAVTVNRFNTSCWPPARTQDA